MPVRVVDGLEVVDVEHHEGDRRPEAAGALELGGERLLEAPAVRQPRQLVRDGLALDPLVQPDVLDGDRRLPGEVLEELALRGGERRAGAGDGDDPGGAGLGLDGAQGVRERVDPVPVDRRRAVRGERLGLRAPDRGLEPGEAARLRDALERAGRVAQPGAAARGPRAVEGRAQDDLEQAVAVEVRREGLARAAHGGGQARLLRPQVLQPLGELRGHRVELLAERRELVLARRAHVGGEVAATQAPRRVEEAPDLPPEGAGDEQGEGEGEHEEAEEDPEGEEAGVADVLRRPVAGQDRDRRRGPREGGRLEGRGAVAVAPQGHVAALPRPGKRCRRGVRARARQRLAVAPQDDLQARDPPDRLDVPARPLGADPEGAEGPARGVHEVEAHGEDRRARAHVDERCAALGADDDALEAQGHEQRLGPGPRHGRAPALQRRGQAGVPADGHRAAPRPREGVVVELRGGLLAPGDPRVGLALLRVGDEPGEHEGQGDHRHDHDEDEEQREAGAEAHAGRADEELPGAAGEQAYGSRSVYTARRTRGCSSAGRAPPSHGGGQGFEPPQLHRMPEAPAPRSGASSVPGSPSRRAPRRARPSARGPAARTGRRGGAPRRTAPRPGPRRRRCAAGRSPRRRP